MQLQEFARDRSSVMRRTPFSFRHDVINWRDVFYRFTNTYIVVEFGNGDLIRVGESPLLDVSDHVHAVEWKNNVKKDNYSAPFALLSSAALKKLCKTLVWLCCRAAISKYFHVNVIHRETMMYTRCTINIKYEIIRDNIVIAKFSYDFQTWSCRMHHTMYIILNELATYSRKLFIYLIFFFLRQQITRNTNVVCNTLITIIERFRCIASALQKHRWVHIIVGFIFVFNPISRMERNISTSSSVIQTICCYIFNDKNISYTCSHRRAARESSITNSEEKSNEMSTSLDVYTMYIVPRRYIIQSC